MTLLVLLILVVALAAWGVLGAVLKVAVGVALGIVFGFIGVSALLVWRVRRALRGPAPPHWRRIRGSRIEVLDRPDRRPHR